METVDMAISSGIKISFINFQILLIDLLYILTISISFLCKR